MCFNRSGQCQTTPQRCSLAGVSLCQCPACPSCSPCSWTTPHLQPGWFCGKCCLEGRRGEARAAAPAEMEPTGCWPSQGRGCASLRALLTLPWTTRAWLGCSWAVPVVPSPTGQWETVHSLKSRRKAHAWRYPSLFIHLHSLPCTLNVFPAFISCCTFQWLWLSDAFSDKTPVFQLLLPKFHYRGLNFPSKHLLQSKSWGENIWNKSRVLWNELMENRVALSTFNKKN